MVEQIYDRTTMGTSQKDEWIVKNLQIYTNLYGRFKQENEKALASCAFSYIKILNSIVGMEYSQFHSYEKQMLWETMRLFSSQCYGQLLEAEKCKDSIGKRELIGDIEKSIIKIFEVYRNIVDGTGEMNRQIIQNTSIDTSMFELSPKVSIYFSKMLEKLRKLIYDRNKIEYAFVLLPSLHSVIHAEVLLEKKESSGKVMVIYIPESAVDNFRLMTVSLIHEGFHILTKEQRNRKVRARLFAECIKICLNEKLFEKVDIGDAIKERICGKWYQDIDILMEKREKEQEDSKLFYGDRFRKDMGTAVFDSLCNLNLQLLKPLEIVRKSLDNRSYEEFQKKYQEISEGIEKIQYNLFYLVSGNKVSKIIEMLMDVFKETYADMACILTLEISPEVYQSAFRNSVSFQNTRNSEDMVRIVRALLVANVVRNYFTGEKRKSWERFYKNELKKHQVNMQNIERRQQEREVESPDVVITPSFELLEHFSEYLAVAANDFYDLLQTINGLGEFREEINSLLQNPTEQTLLEILKGGHKENFNRGLNNENSN